MPAKTYLLYHVIVTTKYRRPLLDNPNVLARVSYAADHQAARRGGHVLAFNYGPDLAHIHILLTLPPSAQLAAWLRDFKSESARLSNAWLGRAGHPFWGRRYFAKTIGAGSLDAARRYVAEQWPK